MSAAARPLLLEVRDLRVRFSDRARSVPAVNRVSFDLEPGESVALVGESGCGKSTIGLAIMGLTGITKPKDLTGTITLAFKSGERRDLTELSDRAMQEVRGNEVAMIFQEPMSSLNPVHTVGWQIREAIKRHQGAKRAIADDTALSLLNQL